MIGRTIGHYEIIGKIGEGGMGAVYKARDIRLDRFVALKMLPGESVANAERTRRFALEAKAASALITPTSSPFTTSTRSSSERRSQTRWRRPTSPESCTGT